MPSGTAEKGHLVKGDNTFFVCLVVFYPLLTKLRPPMSCQMMTGNSCAADATFDFATVPIDGRVLLRRVVDYIASIRVPPFTLFLLVWADAIQTNVIRVANEIFNGLVFLFGE